ncbi:hypothetical protein CEUSTIGMA_g12013.t1 [Chlamydomonas eustigma]|uniref:Major facilitator superfamily (MFS) profile domain-containing protein n=1 Tax=Chlamydomonas eustigma TaxID=1157962 RepID=A0A250XNV3_9CHLO|nr:hypothetical protein CEUSTIGMA_g12013.t1 [Chlamydomonas eustigma]|eukprot:GAX84592.1 hypothetical protein CEUSTIGMA_g12013.t1 [Chlamydomonas eustigma]
MLCNKYLPRKGIGPHRGSHVKNYRRCIPTSTLLSLHSLKGSHEYEAGPDIDWLATWKCFCPPALGGLLFGYDIGVSGGALVSLTSSSSSGTEWGPSLDSLMTGLVVGSSLMGALISSLSVLFLGGDKYGRKTELLGAAGLYSAGSLLMGTAYTLPMLLAGRCFYGLGIGLAMHSSPAYIAETSPSSVRGLLISCKEVSIVAGILLGYFLSDVVGDASEGWRLMYAAVMPLSVVLGVGMALLPESPRWLLLSRKEDAAVNEALKKVLGRVAQGSSGKQILRHQLDEMKKSLPAASSNLERISRVHDADEASSVQQVKDGTSVQLSQVSGGIGSSSTVSQLFLQERFRRPLLIGASLMLYQQVTGQPSVLYFATKLFKDSGLSLGDAEGISVLIGVFKLAMTLAAVSLVDRVGRRPLLLFGVSGMVLALILLSFSSSLSSNEASFGQMLPSVSALLLFVGCYQVSFGPISWLIVGEIFPLEVRSQAIAVATVTNFGSNFMVSLILPGMQNSFGLSATYQCFAAVGVIALASIYFTVPETKGKTLEEIEAMWH